MGKQKLENKIFIGTRFFEKKPDQIKIIEEFANQALLCSAPLLVAVNIQEDKTGAINNPKLKLPGIQIFGVNPWGKFIPALNTLVSKAKTNGADFLLLASAEMRFTSQHFYQLQAFMDEKTLVVGAALPGHDFQEGEREGNGKTVPWNTLSLWNLEYLLRTGFPLISDALADGKNAGVEEVSTIALLQKIYPFLTAKLVQIPGIIRQTKYWDEERLRRYQTELDNRISCPEAQMKIFNIPAPKIIHIKT